MPSRACQRAAIAPDKIPDTFDCTGAHVGPRTKPGHEGRVVEGQLAKPGVIHPGFLKIALNVPQEFVTDAHGEVQYLEKSEVAMGNFLIAREIPKWHTLVHE
jgi:hypothetical protein